MSLARLQNIKSMYKTQLNLCMSNKESGTEILKIYNLQYKKCEKDKFDERCVRLKH